MLMKRLVMDLDNTISKTVGGDYRNAAPVADVVNMMRLYRDRGFEIVISTARNMRTYEGNVGKINANTLPTIIAWLGEHDIPYDEILVGKPWCGYEGFYVDDRAVRPSEFVGMSSEEIERMLRDEL